MRKFISLVTVIIFSMTSVFSQEVNGVIVADTSNFKIIKVWGTHYERGYALGYLDGDGFINVLDKYIKPALGSYYNVLRTYIEQDTKFLISENYKIEAQAMADGIIDAGYANASEVDNIDVLATNCFIDFFGYFNSKNNIPMGCSSLMSWGDATSSTDLGGKSVISRHLDWTPDPYLLGNSRIIAHIPEETDEQPWAQIGFAGLMSALSGINNSGLALFQHVLDDVSGQASKTSVYEPIWFTTRNVLEKADYNEDGQNDVNDLRDAMLSNRSGYASGVIISALSPASFSEDTLIALVAESACTEPYHSFRTNTYDDLIPGDNLYTANESIIRNNANNYSPRYDSIVANIGDGTLISSEKNWNLMAEHSNAGSGNIHFMQFIPDDRILKLSVTDNDNYAYQKEAVCIWIDTLFTIPTTSINEIYGSKEISIFPNPCFGNININFASVNNEIVYVSIYNSIGKIVKTAKFLVKSNEINITLNLSGGIYFAKLNTRRNTYCEKIIIRGE